MYMKMYRSSKSLETMVRCSFQGLGRGREWAGTAHGHEVSFGCHENLPELVVTAAQFVNNYTKSHRIISSD
jgi:hypothetical protein